MSAHDTACTCDRCQMMVAPESRTANDSLTALRAAQARARAALLDPDGIRARQKAGAEMASDHEWRKGLFGRLAPEPVRPRRDGPVKRRQRS